MLFIVENTFLVEKKSFYKLKLVRFKGGKNALPLKKKSSAFNSFITHIKPTKTKVKTFVWYAPELELQAAAPETIHFV